MVRKKSILKGSVRCKIIQEIVFFVLFVKSIEVCCLNLPEKAYLNNRFCTQYTCTLLPHLREKGEHQGSTTENRKRKFRVQDQVR